MSSSLTRGGLAIAVGSAIMYGMWPACMQGIYSGGGNVVFALIFTTWVRSLALALFCVVKKRKLFATREAVKQAMTGGFFQAVSLAGLFAALQFLPGPVVIIILFTHTLMLLFFMAWRKEIKLDALTLLLTTSALVGLGFVLDIWHGVKSGDLYGAALAFVAALATVSRLYVYNRQTRERHPILIGAESYLVAAIMLSPLALFAAAHAPSTLKGDFYTLLGVSAQTLATFGMFYGISLMGSFRWSLYLKMEPLFTALFSAWFLGEILKPGQYAGIGIVLGSLALYQIVEYRLKKQAV